MTRPRLIDRRTRWYRFRLGVRLFWAGVEGRTVEASFVNSDGQWTIIGRVESMR